MIDAPHLQVPPHDAAVERRLVAKAFSAGGGAALSEVAPAAFYVSENRMVWQAMRCLTERREVVDALTLAAELGRLGAVVPEDLAAEVAAAADSPGGIDYYVGKVRDLAHRRRIAEGLADGYQRAHEHGGSAEDLLAGLRSSLGSMAESIAPPDQEELEEAGPELPPFPEHLLCGTFRGIFSAFAAGTESPLELAVTPGLAVLSAALGPGWLVGPEGFARSPGNWFAVVAPSGCGKTPTARPVLEALENEDRRLREEHELKREDYDLKLSELGRKEPRPEPPRRRRLVLTDATVEALALELSRAEGHGILLNADELGSLLASMDGYQGNKRKGRSEILSMWSSSPIRVSRKTSDAIEVDRPFVAVSAGIQPSVLQSLDLSEGDGLAARFLWLHTPRQEECGGLGRPVPLQARDWWSRAVGLALAFEAGDEQRVSSEGEGLIDAYLRETRSMAAEQDRAGAGLVSAVYGKAGEYALRLLSLLHGMDQLEEALEFGGPLRGCEVPTGTVARAIELARWFVRQGLHTTRLVTRTRTADLEAEASEEDQVVGAGLAKLVARGSEESAPAKRWLADLASVGVELEGGSTKARTTRLGKILGRLSGNPFGALEVARLPRGRERGWVVRHLDTCAHVVAQPETRITEGSSTPRHMRHLPRGGE